MENDLGPFTDLDEFEQPMAAPEPKFTPTEFISVVNQSLEYSFSPTLLEGEVASFKVSHGKWVFFDLKDAESSVSCFMTLWNLRVPLEDGMKIVVRGVPKLTKWGKFSLTVSSLKPVGEGSLKRAFEMLKQKLSAEGLFDEAKKRPIPTNLTKLGVISSTGAAGYADFIKILNARWGGIHVQVAHTQVQGLDAPDQIIRALQYFNQRGEVQAIAILRGGGSADDLSCFNDEALVRAVSASKIPVITGIGHEIDESLCDLAADLRASTPSNAAELITPDRRAVIANLRQGVIHAGQKLTEQIELQRDQLSTRLTDIFQQINLQIDNLASTLRQQQRLLEALNPETVLRQGYAIISGKLTPECVVKITTHKHLIKAQIKEVHDRK